MPPVQWDAFLITLLARFHYYKRSSHLGEIAHLVVLEKVLLILHLSRSQEKTPSHSDGLPPGIPCIAASRMDALRDPLPRSSGGSSPIPSPPSPLDWS